MQKQRLVNRQQSFGRRSNDGRTTWPEPEDVEAHSPPVGLPPVGEAHRGEDEDVEAHSPPVGLPPIGEAHRSDDDEDVEAHSPPIGLPPIGEPPIG